MNRSEIIQNIIDRTKTGDLTWTKHKSYFECVWSDDNTYCLQHSLNGSPMSWFEEVVRYKSLWVNGLQVNDKKDPLIEELWNILVDIELQKAVPKEISLRTVLQEGNIGTRLINLAYEGKIKWSIGRECFVGEITDDLFITIYNTPCYLGDNRNRVVVDIPQEQREHLSRIASGTILIEATSKTL